MTPRPYSVDVHLRWADMDSFRHVNNVQFVRLLEEARVRGFREWFAPQEDGHHFPPMLMARVEIHYLRQLTYRTEPIQVRMWVTRIAGASFDLGYEVCDDETVYARAESTLVVFDLQEQRPTRIDTPMRAALDRFAGEPVPMKRRER